MKKLIIILAASIAFLVPAYADGPIMIKNWFNQCSASNKDFVGMTRQMLCKNYARGVADGLSLWQIIDSKSAVVCIPPSVDANQLTEVGKKYFRENPKDQHIEAAVFLSLAFQDAWPCQETPTVNFK